MKKLHFSKLITKMKGLKYFFFLSFLIITAQSCSNTGYTEKIVENNMVGQENLLNDLRLVQTDRGNKQVHFPSEDPGTPLYARTGEILNQYFVTDGWLVIPFYRNPECIREDFNLLTIFDVPAAFACPLTVEGFYMIENDAPQGTFPIIVHSTGSTVPVWMVRWDDFLATTADGILTIEELRSLNPLMGMANRFHETLRPRLENHLVQINASGYLTDGRSFRFHVTHLGSETRSIGLSFN